MNVSVGTIARTACLALALTNQILSAAIKADQTLKVYQSAGK